MKEFTAEIDIFGKARFSILAAERREAEQIVEQMQDPKSENYNEFWDYVFSATEYRVVGVTDSLPG